MSDWKKDLKKLKGQLLSNSETSSSAEEKERNVTSDNIEDWKKDVTPLSQKKKNNKTKFSKSKPRNKSNKANYTKSKPRNKNNTNKNQNDSTVSTNKNKRKKRRKFKKVKNKGYVPSLDAIKRAYGSNEINSKQKIERTKIRHELPVLQTLPNVVLSKSGSYKKPEQWLSNGSLTQPPNGGTGRMISVRIGIDFGTSFTKAAVRAAGQVFFIDWSGVLSSEQSFFLPGEISFEPDGAASLGRSETAIKSITGLKIPFLTEEKPDSNTYGSAIVYLALVLRYIRAWLYHHQKNLFETRKIAWEINIGSPTNPWTKSAIVNRYNRAVKVAWALSKYDENDNILKKVDLLQNHLNQADIEDLDDVFVLPEFVAQIAGHVNSTQSKDGLHLLVDIGAGTVDIAAFNIYRKREDVTRYPIFSGAIVSLGTHLLTAYRLSVSDSHINEWEDVDGIPTKNNLINNYGLDPLKLGQMDNAFEYCLASKVGQLLRYTKQIRYSQASEWKKGMRVFLAGGGSLCSIYKSAISRAFSDINVKPIYLVLPVNEDLHGQIDDKTFHRLSVAFGLTYDAESIGKIYDPKSIPDARLNLTRRELISHEEIYSDK